MLKVRKPTGPIANKPMPQGSRWKTYWGKCSVLGVPMTMFVKPKIPEKEVV